MTRVKLAAAALLLSAGMASNAQAATVFKTLQVIGSGFSPSGTGTIDPISLTFTLNFDNSADFSNNVVGVTQISNNAYGPLKIGYRTSGDVLSLVGGASASAGPGSCSNDTSSFCSFISNISSASPTSTFMLQIDSNNLLSFARSVSVSNVAAVPEPSVWATMLLGFAVAGAAMRRRRAGARTSVSYA